MTPAYSVIFFTVSSGAGYGLLAWLAGLYLVGAWSPVGPGATSGRVALATGVVLVVAGLMSSTFHLGHPERAWRAFSQWRSSWLSREGVMAVASFVPLTIFAAAWFFAPAATGWPAVAAGLIVVTAAATVYCTAMIYASLKPVPAWHTRWVPAAYLGFAAASGLLLAIAIYSLSRDATPVVLTIAALSLIAGWLIRVAGWRHVDRRSPASDMASATGLGRGGRIHMLEAPHTSDNYVLREMGFRIARRHAAKLRRIALVTGAAIPVAALFVAAATVGVVQTALLGAAAANMLLGLIIERWLFFAEARHVVTLYYGRAAQE